MINKVASALTIMFSFILITPVSFAQEKDTEYVFRNNVRPVYQNTINQKQFSQFQKDKKITIIDVRLIEDFAHDPTLIPGAEYKNPETIMSWADAIPKNKKVVLYCVKGGWVSHKAAAFLSEKGYDVVTLEGGILQWKTLNHKE